MNVFLRSIKIKGEILKITDFNRITVDIYYTITEQLHIGPYFGVPTGMSEESPKLKCLFPAQVSQIE